MADLTMTLGCDLDLRPGDLVYSSLDDLGLVAGDGYIQQRILLIAVTEPGTLLMHPSFGAGTGDVIDQPLTAAKQMQIENRLATQIALEPWCQSVQSVTATMDESASTLIITVLYTPVNGTAPIPTSVKVQF